MESVFRIYLYVYFELFIKYSTEYFRVRRGKYSKRIHNYLYNYEYCIFEYYPGVSVYFFRNTNGSRPS